MRKISLDHDPNREFLTDLNVYNWPIETVEVSEFPMHYEEKETCFLIEGEAIVTQENDEPINIGVGDLVTFPKGISCTWKVVKEIRCHYNIG
jgi:uncharacterized cupin superfamily protein